MYRLCKATYDGIIKGTAVLGVYDTVEEAKEKLRNEMNTVDAPRMIKITIGMPTEKDVSLLSYFIRKSFDEHDTYATLTTKDEKTVYNICPVCQRN